MPRLTIIVASTRPGRVGRQIADWFTAQARTHTGFDTHLVDLAEVGLPLLDEPGDPTEQRYRHQHTRDWSATIEATDAVVLVMPEYNNGFNAALKNAIDYLYYEWQHKPVGVVCYGMSSAGLRAALMIKPVLSAVNLVPVSPTVAIPLRQHLSDTGQLRPSEQLDRSAAAMLHELHRFTTALAPLRRPREHVP